MLNRAADENKEIVMVRALRNWLEANQLPAIIIGVLGVILLIAVVLVVGGYFVAAMVAS